MTPPNQDYPLDNETLKILCDFSLELVRIRQSNVPHLCTENCGPETLQKAIRAYLRELDCV